MYESFRRIILCFAVVFVFGTIVLMMVFSFGAKETYPDDIFIRAIDVESDEGKVRIIGDLRSSGMAYSAYSVERDGGTLFLHIKTRPVSPFNSNGSFDLMIENDDGETIDEIILVGQGLSKKIY